MSEPKLSENFRNTSSKDKWRRIGFKRRSGALIPLFSVYSRNSVGIGDLSDLKLVIDWLKLTGNSIIQLLPLNETGAIPCPYDSLSSFALEPAYISLRDLSCVDNKLIRNKIEVIAKLFPAGRTRIDYGIKQQKIQILRDIFFKDKKGGSSEFRKFRKEFAYWLVDFALFKVLKEYHGGKAWYDWEDKYKNRDFRCLENFRRYHEDEILFQMWVQWQLYRQFRDVKKYAKAKKVLLKGDLPILVSRDSADVWAHPEFFKLDFAAGAPPDMYCAKGQRWGMPTYNWEAISFDKFRYIKERLRYAQNFYDILRIDHVVGLFRIWSIPYDEPLENKGLNGFFDPQDEKRWGEHGRNILRTMLKSTDMLFCGEDLGVIPKICPDTLKQFAIPGSDVQRWTKDWKFKHDFLKPQEYRILSAAMLSVHDSTNWPAWWENEAGTVDENLFMRKCNDHRQINFHNIKNNLFDTSHCGHGRVRWLESIDSVDKLVAILGRKKEELADFIDLYENSYREKEKLWRHLKINGPMREKSDAEIVRAALKMTLDSQAIFCIQLIIDWLYLSDIFEGGPYQYRINTPSTVSPNNWSMVIPICLEDLLKHSVNNEIRKLIASSGRI